MSGKNTFLITLITVVLCLSFTACSPQEQQEAGTGEAEKQELQQNESNSSDGTEPTQSDPEPVVDDLTKEECLACHGSYDTIMQGSEGWTSPEGETVNPHTTVDMTIPTHENPHESDAEAVECIKCHTVHPSDVTSADQVEKPDNVNYCYNNCHHERNFDKCSKCH